MSTMFEAPALLIAPPFWLPPYNDEGACDCECVPLLEKRSKDCMLVFGNVDADILYCTVLLPHVIG